MKTIEERSKEYVDRNFHRIAEMPITNGMETIFFESATEQRDIDIERAVEWFSANWRNYIDQDADGMIRFGGWKNDFENEMKEEQL